VGAQSRTARWNIRASGTIWLQAVGVRSACAGCFRDPLLDDVGALEQGVSIFDQARRLFFARELLQLGPGSAVFVDVAHFHQFAEAEIAPGQQGCAGKAALVLHEEGALLAPLWLCFGWEVAGVFGIDFFGEPAKFIDVPGSPRSDRGDVLHDTICVDDHRGSIRDPLVGQVETKFLGDGTLGVEVGEQRNADASETVGPVGVTVDAVDADSDDLGVSGFETTLQRIQRWHFEASGRCEVEGVEEKEKMLLADEIGGRNRAAEMIGQGKLRRFASY